MKTFVLDTNVLINDPHALFKFDDNQVVIPIVVLQELDGLKKRKDTTGQAAREVARILDGLRSKGKLHKGVALDSGGELLLLNEVPTPQFVIPGNIENDYVILQNCLDFGGDLCLVTDDINMRVIADTLDITAERYRNSIVKNTSFYDETRSFHVEPRVIDGLYDQDAWSGGIGEDDFIENEYMVFEHASQRVLVRYSMGIFQRVKRRSIQGVSARNHEQNFAMDALTDPNISLVTLAGKAGTGKTLLAIASGLEQTIETGAIYKKITVARPLVPMGRDVGFLPGSLDEKLNPWMGPIYDNIDYIMPSSKPEYSNASYLQDKGWLSIQALTYIRGRSMPQQFIIIDECQNLSQHEVKTIVTRAGMGTKLVFTGDPYQIDSPYLDQFNNGLSYLIDSFKGQQCFANVTLTKGERSPLAELGAQIL